MKLNSCSVLCLCPVYMQLVEVGLLQIGIMSMASHLSAIAAINEN